MIALARNTEIKARISSVEAIAPQVAAIADQGPIAIEQDDTFFLCEQGRLKLRAFSPTQGELIFYQRSNESGPKESSYIICPTDHPELLRETLTLAYGRTGRVRKHRMLYLVGRTRVHLDRVTGLGDFLELEVVLAENEPLEAGVTEANRLMQLLGINPADLIDRAYVDLMITPGSVE